MKTMNDVYGDNSDHECCELCGNCIPCGDCDKWGCGRDGGPIGHKGSRLVSKEEMENQ